MKTGGCCTCDWAVVRLAAPMARSALSERPTMRCDTPSAPRATLAGGRWRGANALCAGNPASPRDPRHPTPPPPVSSHPGTAGGKHLRRPLWRPVANSGGTGPEKFRKMEKLGGGSPGTRRQVVLAAAHQPQPATRQSGGLRNACGTHRSQRHITTSRAACKAPTAGRS